ncbi:MAG: hypothetical protein J3R72DRAFT_450682 [Linnemannia gamsii]|nr:MAG: hypothetical protein J3R72DRAFT_450682 [Linnemannia gamsii]
MTDSCGLEPWLFFCVCLSWTLFMLHMPSRSRSIARLSLLLGYFFFFLCEDVTVVGSMEE